ncbi:pyridoxamine 5'-phosphate oxidase family protein [Streptomyces sp. NPDC004111]|uniref:pyridoxamine 5'-phosphate oxidase family protein n=1 Tax=Streptomyces sp. NPDC004111 TaxID=3364690 RepID=UPI0036BC644D
MTSELPAASRTFLTDAATRKFLTDPHTATFTTLRPDGTPHVTPVRFTFDTAAGLARVTTRAGARKARNVAAGGPAARIALCQADGFRWVTLEGLATVTDDPARLAKAVRRYTDRYRAAPPAPPDLVVIEIAVDRVLTLPRGLPSAASRAE